MATKPTRLALSIAAALALPAGAAAEISTFGYIKNETAIFVKDGQPTGSERSAVDDADTRTAGEAMKFENSARLFINGDITEDILWHGDINIIYDTKAIDDGGVEYEGHRLYSQHDWLKELYVDWYADDWDVRIGKQQIVWGTADGIKLLDIINPTDFRELVQNDFEDSRIPLWMVKAERNILDQGNIQFIVSQHEENKIPGLNSDGDAGHPFILKGVDTITGEVNGFLNIAPNLANTATNFHLGAIGGFFDTGTNPGGVPGAPATPGTPADGIGDAILDPAGTPFGAFAGLTPFGTLTVDGFANTNQQVNDPDNSLAATGQLSGDESILANPAGTTFPGPITPVSGGFLLNSIAQNGSALPNPFPAANDNNNKTNLVGPVYEPRDPDSAFEYMPNATFATFNTFAGSNFNFGPVSSIATQYKRDYPDDENLNAGFRFRQRLPNGFNYSLNYFYHYSANPTVSLSWHDSATGQELDTVRSRHGDFNGDGFPDAVDPNNVTGIGGTVAPDQVPNAIATDPFGFGQAVNGVSVLLRNPATGAYYGAATPGPGLTLSNNQAVLRFTEELHRVHSVGASFDYALAGTAIPTVIRGEFLYDIDEKQPIIDKRLLAIGDLANALTIEDADFFKYVIGADFTVLTNMLVSGQFIQFRNLDYEDEDRTCTTQTGQRFDCSRYTGDFPSLHLSNGLQQDEENKEFYSLFFSKPFGPSDEHRWNNITIYEENGGWWNRFDVEYSFTDLLIGSAQWNQYWGDDDTQFGQFEDSSSIQVGLKYIIE